MPPSGEMGEAAGLELAARHRGVHGVPRACGAVGEYDPQRVAAAAAALGPGVEPATVEGDPAILYCDHLPLRWAGPEWSGCGWAERPEVAAVDGHRWQDAATCGVNGVALREGEALVHASSHGLAPLFVLPEARAAYFATDLSALVAAAAAPLDPDWDAWAQIFEIGMPLGRRTPFRQISRLEPNEYVSLTQGRDAAFGREPWPWHVTPSGTDLATANAEIVAAIDRRLRAAAELTGRLRLPLTAGWDSRLFGVLIANAGIECEAWTVNGDAGHASQERIAGLLAGELGFRHHTVMPPVADHWRDWRAACRLQNYEAPIHLPIAGLAAGMPLGPDPIVDGLAAMLPKGFWVDRPLLDAPWPEAVDGLWRRFRFSVDGHRLLRRRVARPIRARAQRAFRAEADRFAGHEAALTLFITWARGRRSIAPSPFCLLGSRGPVCTPFTDDAVAHASLSIPPGEKLGHASFRRMMAEVDPRLTDWPSDHDEGFDPGPRNLPRRFLSREALDGYAELLADHPLRELFSEPFARDLSRGKLRPYVEHRQRRLALDAICRFALWYRDHAPSLAPLEPERLAEG